MFAVTARVLMVTVAPMATITGAGMAASSMAADFMAAYIGHGLALTAGIYLMDTTHFTGAIILIISAMVIFTGITMMNTPLLSPRLAH